MTIAGPLAGLPPYGPAAISFPRRDAFREGFVVQFSPEEREVWIGNFARYGQMDDSIHPELGETAILIIAGGAGYLVNALNHDAQEIGFPILWTCFASELKAMVISNGLWFEAFDANRSLWRSRRLSWDGVRKVVSSDNLATGEAFDPMTDKWLPFRVNLLTGDAEGGSYNMP